MTKSNVKYVVVEFKNNSGRYVALRGLSFATKEDGEAYIVATYNEKWRNRYHVESRVIFADDSSERMTCQCCQRKILANTGLIAAHGYERPGHGWQTSSCYGARAKPWEASRDVVGILIEHLKKTLVNLENHLRATKDETAAITKQYRTRDTSTRKDVVHNISFTRETFDATVAAHPKAFSKYYPLDTFDSCKKTDIEIQARNIKRIISDINEFQNRYDGWKQTHERKNGMWVSI